MRSRSLRPGGWLVTGTFGGPGELGMALARLRTVRAGGRLLDSGGKSATRPLAHLQHHAMSQTRANGPRTLTVYWPEASRPARSLDLDERWQAIVDLAVALAPTSPAVTPEHGARLRQLGLSDVEILDEIRAAASFAWRRIGERARVAGVISMRTVGRAQKTLLIVDERASLRSGSPPS